MNDKLLDPGTSDEGDSGGRDPGTNLEQDGACLQVARQGTHGPSRQHDLMDQAGGRQWALRIAPTRPCHPRAIDRCGGLDRHDRIGSLWQARAGRDPDGTSRHHTHV